MKILVIHTSAGAGHTKAAQALADGIKFTTPYDIVCVDALDYTSSLHRKLYRGLYVFLVTKLPWAWEIFFGLTDVPLLRLLVRCIRRIFNAINFHSLEQFIKEENFDYILSTHFLGTEIAGYLKRSKKITSKVVTVITDFDVHSIWLARGVDYYAVACDYTKEKLLSLRIPEAKIKVTGIPTHSKFRTVHNRKELQWRLGLKENVFTVLIATGSFGTGPIKKIMESLEDYQILVVCGNNKKLFNELTHVTMGMVRVYGLVDNMHELMAVADTMITKPGGLSIAEALVNGLPLIFFNAIPGQETQNIKVLQKYGVGISDCSIIEISQKLKEISTSQEQLHLAQLKSKALARPQAVGEIIKLIQN